MSDKRRALILAIILALSVGLLIYVKTHIGQGFIQQL